MPKITIDVPEYCDDCMFKTNRWNWTMCDEITCGLFNKRIERDSDRNQYIPCDECLKRRKEYEDKERILHKMD